MPWCHTCSKYWTPAAMRSDGSCPTCGAVLVIGGAGEQRDPDDPGVEGDRIADVAEADDDVEAADDDAVAAGDHDDGGVPWHFKLLIVLLVIYLVYRFVEIGIKIFT